MLSGKPGVGKTLSAESCAERLQLPLYKMELREDDGYASADCDTNQASYNATNTRASIEKQFELVTKWNAVLLVDECDAFLQKRSREDPERNVVMSSKNYFFLRNCCDRSRADLFTAFLQKLEYYQSLIFLTTNVVESLDPAVLSRVHLTINYPDLDEESRNTVWRNFLARVRPAAMVSDAEVEILGKLPLNGRRIKNAVKTAQIMANREDRGVTLDDIRKVMRITEGLTID